MDDLPIDWLSTPCERPAHAPESPTPLQRVRSDRARLRLRVADLMWLAGASALISVVARAASVRPEQVGWNMAAGLAGLAIGVGFPVGLVGIYSVEQVSLALSRSAKSWKARRQARIDRARKAVVIGPATPRTLKWFLHLGELLPFLLPLVAISIGSMISELFLCSSFWQVATMLGWHMARHVIQRAAPAPTLTDRPDPSVDSASGPA